MTAPRPAPDIRAPGTADRSPGMRFTVDGWDPTYGTSLELEEDLGESTAQVQLDVEMPEDRWQPVTVDPAVRRPSATLFVDGVRRVEARVWIDDADGGSPATDASAALCASYAAGVVCCCGIGAHLLTAQTRRGLFTVAPHAVDVRTGAGSYLACHTTANATMPLSVTLSSALQRRLAEVEVTVAVAARAGLAAGTTGDARALTAAGAGSAGSAAGAAGAMSAPAGLDAAAPGALGDHDVIRADDLLVVDGPLRGRTHLPRALGFIKSHRTAYLPPAQHAMVGRLGHGQRTPVFLMGTTWDRHAWYLRLPCLPGPPWAGIVRVECSADLPRDEVVALANLSQATLCRFASAEYKNARAPQNLYPIAGLESELRRRLGDPRLLYRALRVAAAG